MSRGGARANSGPPPDPTSFRTYQRRASGEKVSVAPGWIVLPVTGRAGPPPEWPLTVATERELVLWALLWAKPQATEWERLGQDLEVALYVRRLTEVDRPESTAAIGSLLIRMGESLGLTIPGLAARKWQIGSADRAGLASVTSLPNDPLPGQWPSARDRIKHVRPPDEDEDLRDRFGRRGYYDQAADAAGQDD